MKNKFFRRETITPPHQSEFQAKSFFAKTPLKLGTTEIICIASISVGLTSWFIATSKPKPSAPPQQIVERKISRPETPTFKVEPPVFPKIETAMQEPLKALPVQPRAQIEKPMPQQKPAPVEAIAEKTAIEPKPIEAKKEEAENWSIGEVDPKAIALLHDNTSKYAALLAQEKQIMEQAALRRPQRTFVGYAPEASSNGGTATSANGSSGGYATSAAGRAPSSTVQVGTLGQAKLGQIQWNTFAAYVPAAVNSLANRAPSAAQNIVNAAIPTPVFSRAPAIARNANGCCIKPPAIYDAACRASYPCKVCGGCCCLCEAYRARLI